MSCMFAPYLAFAQTIESLVMPGDVVSGHADIEENCKGCHKRFDRKAQRDLCLDCHEDVAGDEQATTRAGALRSIELRLAAGRGALGLGGCGWLGGRGPVWIALLRGRGGGARRRVG